MLCAPWPSTSPRWTLSALVSTRRQSSPGAKFKDPSSSETSFKMDPWDFCDDVIKPSLLPPLMIVEREEITCPRSGLSEASWLQHVVMRTAIAGFHDLRTLGRIPCSAMSMASFIAVSRWKMVNGRSCEAVGKAHARAVSRIGQKHREQNKRPAHTHPVADLIHRHCKRVDVGRKAITLSS